MSDSNRFRLILSDPLLEGGQRVGTYSPRPVSIEQVVALLCEHFGFQKLCSERGVDVKKLANKPGDLHITGIDGPRRTPIFSDPQLVDFAAGARNTRLPSFEVQLAVARVAAPQDRASKPTGRLPKDRIEELEDEKFKALRANERFERRIDELERRMVAGRDDIDRQIKFTKDGLETVQEEIRSKLQVQLDALVEADKGILQDLDVVRQHGLKVEEESKQADQELQSTIEQMGQRVQAQFEDVNVEMDDIRKEGAKLRSEVESGLEETRAEIAKFKEEVERLDQVKVSVEPWRQAEEAMQADIDAKWEKLKKTIALTEEQLRYEIEEAQKPLRAAIEQLNQDLEAACVRIDRELQRLEADLQAGLKAAADALEEVRATLQEDIDTKINNLTESTSKNFKEVRADVAAKDKAINGKVDALSAKTEKSFIELEERLEEMIRVERARLGTIERDMAETTTKIRSDFRAEIERVRTDYEQEAARLDTDLGDLHVKHDVTKQEINFFQSRLAEQKDWTQRQITETATATRAVQVDAQEGLAASTKMLHALKDDAVHFRDKMAKYISLLQHSSDAHGDAITALETQRGRMRSELDALIGDHKAYTGDMDGWADDVRVKVERLFRALEPAKVEWRLARAQQRAKELRRPLAVKSPSFSLRGLREVQFEFFPDGHNNSAEGKSVLRLFLPPNAHARYQCWVGRDSDGAREYGPGSPLSVDIQVDNWKDQIQDDGAVYITMEVLRDMNNDDESLSREVRVETP